MAPPCSLRLASERDFPALLAIHEASFRALVEGRFAWDPSFQRERLLEGGLGEVVEAAGEVVGQWLVERGPEELYLARVMIAPAWRGRGIATHLIQNLQAEARARGVGVALSVWEENPARALYERLGFVAQAQREFRVPMRWEPPLTPSTSATSSSGSAG